MSAFENLLLNLDSILKQAKHVKAISFKFSSDWMALREFIDRIKVVIRRFKDLKLVDMNVMCRKTGASVNNRSDISSLRRTLEEENGVEVET